MDTINSKVQFIDNKKNINDLDFLWLELTNQCNLECVHCYTESGPNSTERDLLKPEKYEALIHEAFALGCRKIQFIGGEPTLHKHLSNYLLCASKLGYMYIEVFSNLIHLPDDLLVIAKRTGACFATSFYSQNTDIHNSITKGHKSQERTLRNIERLVELKIPLRVGLIDMPGFDQKLDDTKDFLISMGVTNFGLSIAREFGRGEDLINKEASVSGLCGSCANGKLCIAPNGDVFPCTMSRNWLVGNVLVNSLSEITKGRRIQKTRGELLANFATRLRNVSSEDCGPCQQSCHPTNEGCGPDESCGPLRCPQTPCSPALSDDPEFTPNYDC